jgi:MFS family permease
MIASRQTKSSQELPSLGPALAAMTGTQALVALALFAPGVLAPRLGLSVGDVSRFAATVFAVGMATSFYGGRLADRFGACRVAAFCAFAVAAGMLCAATSSSTPVLIAAGVLVGLAFGPETPASSNLLGRLARPEQRPLIFSVRQTGNQIGAVVGSLTLPVIAGIAPELGYLLIAALAVAAMLMLLWLSKRYDLLTTAVGTPAPRGVRPSFADLDRRLVALATLSVAFSAMQLALNAYFVTHGVTALQLNHVTAGILLAVAQVGGLVGRLLWGQVATTWASPGSVLAGLGIGMSISAITVALLASALPTPALYVLAFAFGLTASGWNGVFLAEVARLAPAGRVAETTGAVLTASYGGLLLAPLVIAVLSPQGTLGLSYAVIALAVALATVNFIRSNWDDGKRSDDRA